MDVIDPNLALQLKEEGLIYFSDNKPGFFRQKRGKDFTYYDLSGKKITDEKNLDRIKYLRIPPAWNNVWVSPKANSHLQATGIDERDRKQYIYHSDWVNISQQNKFSKLVDFGLSLPRIREKVNFDMQLNKLNKQKVIATIIWLLENTFIRVGNDEYSKENKSYGATTLRNKHVEFDGSSVRFRFTGKSGVSHMIQIKHPKIVKTVKQCVELPGFELFQYIDEDGNRHTITSEDINEFLKDTTKQDFTTKDFRTWGATNSCANYLHGSGFYPDEKVIRQNLISAIKSTAQILNNTVSVCKKYYIHPTVFETYNKNILVPHFDRFKQKPQGKKNLNWSENALIKLLQKHSI